MCATTVLEQGLTSKHQQMTAVVGLTNGVRGGEEEISREVNGFTNIVDLGYNGEQLDKPLMQLELEDGTYYRGFSFGSKRSVAGELVFQTGMVGYPEAITDPSYRGQILVVTFPLVGNYGVPSRDTVDETLGSLPAHFEASQIHVAGLVVASYSGEDYSHFQAASSLGRWLEEQGVPAMYGVDTRALTKKIRENGSMLGKLLSEETFTEKAVNGADGSRAREAPHFESLDWYNPNTRNLVADGENHRIVLAPCT